MNTSWVMSSASCWLPDSRYASRYTRGACVRTTSSHDGGTQPGETVPASATGSPPDVSGALAAPHHVPVRDRSASLQRWIRWPGSPSPVMSSTRYPAQGFSDSEDMIVTEDAVLAAARARAAEVGCAPVSPEAGTALRLLTAALGARAVVEIGTGTGVSGVWLLRGMRPGGILT